MTDKPPTIQNNRFNVSLPMQTKSIKNDNGVWHVVIEALGNRPRFESTSDSRGVALHHLERQVDKWVTKLIEESTKQ